VNIRHIFFLGLMISPVFTHADTIQSGSTCHSITPAQAKKMEWRKEGLKNTATQDYWINCPFERPHGKQALALSLRAVNESNFSLPLQCDFREIHSGRQHQSRSVNVTLSADSAEVLAWQVDPLFEDSVFNAACKLSDGITIEATRAAFSKNCNDSSMVGRWFYMEGLLLEGYEGGTLEFHADGTLSGVFFRNRDQEYTLSGEYLVDSSCGVEGDFRVGGIRFPFMGKL